MTKLLLITTGLYFDPTDTAALLKYETLSDAGFSGLIFCVVYDHKLKDSSIGNFKTISLYLPTFLQGYGSLRGPLRALYYSFFCLWKGIHHRKQYDICVASDTFKTGTLSYLLFKMIRKPYIVEVAGNYIRCFKFDSENNSLLSRAKQAYVKAISPLVLERAAAVKLLYEKQINGLANLKNTSKVNVFHDLIAYDYFRITNIDEKFILSVGHPWHLKGMDVLIKAFNKIQDKIPEYRLHIVGYSPDISEFEPLASTNPNIILSNEGMPFKETADLIMSCSLFALASRTEAMGRVLLEAMASGKPVVASNVDGIPRVVQDDVNGLLFETNNIDELAEKMLTLLSNRTYAEKLIKAGLHTINNQFSRDAYIKSYQSMVMFATEKSQPY